MTSLIRSSARGAALALAASCAVACSSSSKGPSGPLPDDQTWSDGKQISAPLTIATGTTITIAPGATITVAKGVAITVQGKLQSSSRAQHAKIVGDAWGGIVVDEGALDLDGVDLTNAATALSVKTGTATYQYGTITGSVPFNVQQNGQLTVAHATAAGTTGPSQILGQFTATFMDYDAGPKEGIYAQDPGAVVSIEDSKLHGNHAGDNDLIIASNAAQVHVAYVDLTAMHCGFHFDNVQAFDVSFVQIHDGAYGMMLYGSTGDGPRTVKSTNIFKNAGLGVDEGSPNAANGPIAISDGYWASNGQTADDDIHSFTGAITTSNMSTTTPVAGTGPRGAVP